MENSIEQRALKIRRFSRFYTNFIGLVNKTILESDYSLAEVRVMLEIDAAGSSTATQLRKILQIDPGYLSRILLRFKKEALITVMESRSDKRAQILTLTQKGKDTFDKVSNASTEQLRNILDSIPEQEQEKVVDCMQKIESILSGQNKPEFTIRNYHSGDAGYIVYRHGVLYEKEYHLAPIFEKYVLAGLLKFLENPSCGEIWMAESDGRIAGFIAVVEVGDNSAQLRWFLIEPEFRGKGLGQQLMSKVLEYCRQKKIDRIFLWTFKGLDSARHLYSKNGFIQTEEAQNDTWKKDLIEERWELQLLEVID